MKFMLNSVAVIALAASGAQAEPGKGNGKEHGDRGKPAAAAQKQPGKSDAAEQRQPQRSERREVRADTRREVGKAHEDRRVKADKDNRSKARDERRDERHDRGRDSARFERGHDSRDRFVDRVVYRDERILLARDRDRGLINGCPPGLAKKHNGCLPPGQAKKRYYERAAFGGLYRPRLFGLGAYPTGRYVYDDGFLLRLGDGGGIGGYIPLLGGALTIGNPWPAAYRYNPVPSYYVDYFNLGAPDRYRYADNVIYRVDGDDAAILGVAALLTGNDIEIGQPMPAGYDVYNVPYPYRDRYRDTPDARYRYSDGYVYRIDPTTQLVAAAIDLIV